MNAPAHACLACFPFLRSCMLNWIFRLIALTFNHDYVDYGLCRLGQGLTRYGHATITIHNGGLHFGGD